MDHRRKISRMSQAVFNICSTTVADAAGLHPERRRVTQDAHRRMWVAIVQDGNPSNASRTSRKNR